MILTKNEQIKKTLLETRLRRATQRCLIYEFKINTRKLNKKEFEQLKFYFVQCRWLYNYLLNLKNIDDFDTKTRIIYSLDKDKNKIKRELTIPAKIIQTVYKGIKQSIKGLSVVKKKGKKVGKLKYQYPRQIKPRLPSFHS